MSYRSTSLLDDASLELKPVLTDVQEESDDRTRPQEPRDQ
jgi:hypothetical protein